MSSSVTLPLWLFILILLFAIVTFASHFLFPSVRWFFRLRLERAVARLNSRLERPIQPFKLARRYDMIQRLIYDPDVMRAVASHAAAEKIPENVAAEQARRYAREIVPAFSATAYFGFAIRAARWLSNALFDVRLGQLHTGPLESIDPEATVVFVMNHRSNMDYVLVTYLAAERSALSYAVGEWAQIWPLSWLIRAMGAYFIRRESRNELYRTVLARYVHLATSAGVTQAMFPEGRLSRTGALSDPRLGLLKYLTDDFGPASRDVVFVPVALNYDRVLEDRRLIAAANRQGHRFNAGLGIVMKNVLRQLWLRLTGRYHRFGSAVVSFGTPLSLRSYNAGGDERSLEQLSEELMRRIGSIVPILPVPLIAWIILKCGRMTRVEIEFAMGRIAEELGRGNLHLPRDNRGYAAEIGLSQLMHRKILTLDEEGRYAVRPEEADVLQFYANSIRHLMPAELIGYSASAK